VEQELQILIDYLKNEMYVKIGVSKIEGVGLIAMKDIPKGIDIGTPPPWSLYMRLKQKFLNELLPSNIFEILKDWSGHGDVIDISLTPYDKNHYYKYINHSNEPNMHYKKREPHQLAGVYDYGMISIKDIKEGEELTVDYNNFDWSGVVCEWCTKI